MLNRLKVHRELRRLASRRISTTQTPAANVPESLLAWSESAHSLTLTDTLSAEHLADLYITLPTRDGVAKPPFQPPQLGSQLGYGHHLVFCHPRNPESRLRPCDGTDAEFSPPEPFNRRMWAGGKFEWNSEDPLLVGDKIIATSTVRPDNMIEFRREHQKQPSMVEERRHVYLASLAGGRAPRPVQDIPTKADFELRYTPTPTTLFRFSALTFNAHFIHLDREHARQVEGYPERLVHGPLTALMLLETVAFHHPGVRLKSFDYRARNPVIVNRPLTVCGAWESKDTAKLWCMDNSGVVGMTAVAQTC